MLVSVILGPNTPHTSTGAGQSPLYRQISQGGGDKSRMSDTKTRDPISDLKTFKENFLYPRPIH